MRDKEIRKEIIKQNNEKGFLTIELESGKTAHNKQAYIYHLLGGIRLTRLLPDLLVVPNNGKPPYFVEIKGKNDYLSEGQKLAFTLLYRQGFSIVIVSDGMRSNFFEPYEHLSTYDIVARLKVVKR